MCSDNFVTGFACFLSSQDANYCDHYQWRFKMLYFSYFDLHFFTSLLSLCCAVSSCRPNPAPSQLNQFKVSNLDLHSFTSIWCWITDPNHAWDRAGHGHFLDRSNYDHHSSHLTFDVELLTPSMRESVPVIFTFSIVRIVIIIPIISLWCRTIDTNHTSDRAGRFHLLDRSNCDPHPSHLAFM